MKRFAILLLPLCVAIAPTGSAQIGSDDPVITEPRQQAAAPRMAPRGPRPGLQAPQPQAPRNLPPVQRPPQNFRSFPPVQRMRPPVDADVSISPGMRHRPYRPRIEPNPAHQGVIAPAPQPVINPAPVPQPPAITPPVTQPVAPERPDRNWTGRGGNGGDWRTRNGIVGNENWRPRSGGGNGNDVWRGRRGDGNNWRNNDNDGDRARRRGHWRNDENRRRQWTEHRLHRRNEWSRHRRNRDWWTSRYNRFALFGGGYYYWNSGYWYPAYGYDPYFSTYTYDAPIYSYNNQDPGDVIANVQQALQQQGYYQGDLDGSFGPLTRQALLAYQRDNGLPVTGEIDQETLGALGFE